jgi:serine phosphatase RsbU (regulator of sigma subunit)
MSKEQEEFGDARLAALAVDLRMRTADDFLDGVRTAIREYTTDAPQSDDITILVAQRLS